MNGCLGCVSMLTELNEFEQRIRSLFPRASQSFIDANAGLCAKKPEPTPRPALVNPASGKTKSDARIVLSYILHRVRLLDPDNAYGATKTITDCLCQIGLLPGDSEHEIEIKVTQEKVNHYEEQRTTLHIKYP